MRPRLQKSLYTVACRDWPGSKGTEDAAPHQGQCFPLARAPAAPSPHSHGGYANMLSACKQVWLTSGSSTVKTWQNQGGLHGKGPPECPECSLPWPWACPGVVRCSTISGEVLAVHTTCSECHGEPRHLHSHRKNQQHPFLGFQGWSNPSQHA